MLFICVLKNIRMQSIFERNFFLQILSETQFIQ